jgi:glucans biosynthesis protein C
MLLGLVTHGALPFTATGLVPFPVRDATRHPAADAVYFAVHDFRMQLFFLLAGFAAASLGAARGVGAVARNRLTRVAAPLAFAAVTVCPLMHLIVARHTAASGAVQRRR